MANRLISGGYSAFVLGAKGWGTHLSRNALRGSKPAPPAQEILKPTLAVLFPRGAENGVENADWAPGPLFGHPR